MMIKPFALISELVSIDHGKYIVKVTVTQEDRVLGSALAAADTVETAEDKARQRAIDVVEWCQKEETETYSQQKKETPKIVQKEPITTKKTAEIPKPEIPKPQPTPPPIIEELPTPPPPPPPSQESVIVEQNEDLWEEYNNNTDEIQENPPIINNPPPLEEKNDLPLQIDDIPLFESDDQNSPDEITNDNLIQFPSANDEESSIEPTLPLEYSETLDFSQIIDQTAIEMKRLGWTQEQGKKYLLETYGKKSRHLLSDHELIEFLNYLQTQ